MPSETGSKGSLALKPSQRRYAAAGFALFSPTLLSVSLTFCRSLGFLVGQLPGCPSAKFRAVSVAVPHCCGGRQRFGHRRCRSRVACTSPKDVGFLGLATDLPSRTHYPKPCGPVVCASFGLTLNARLSLRSWGFRRGLAPLIRFRAAPVRSTVFHIAKDYRGIAVASFAVRFKGCSPQ